jgi:cysteine desulfurase
LAIAKAMPYKRSMKTRLYLDYNATAPLRPEAAALISEIGAQPHNASAVHAFGRAGRKYIEAAREQIATLCGAPPTQVIFNSGATEGNNTVLAHFKNERILISSIEHPCVLEAAKENTQNCERIPVTQDGVIDLAALETLLKKEKTALVSVMAVNNETGVIQPTAKISALAHKYGALYHCDGVQAAGRIPLSMTAMGIDFLTLSAHKIGGPQGVGALVLGLCGITPTLLHGGGQEKRARAGTENVAGIAAFGLAATLAQNTNLTQWRDHLETELLKITPQTLIHGKNAPRVGNTSLFSLPGLSSETLLMAFDLEGIALSNGSACSSGRIEPSHVLTAMGASNKIASAALRVSMGWATQEKDIEHVLAVWSNITHRLKDKIAAHA